MELIQELKGLTLCMLHRGANGADLSAIYDLDCESCLVITDCPLAPVFDHDGAMLVLDHCINGPPASEHPSQLL